MADARAGGLPALAADANCATYFPREARAAALPRGLLESIAQVETGGANSTASADGWPWAIHVNDEGRYFATKDEAVAAARRLLAQGEDSLDVGCMQVNLHYHPEAFASLEDAFDPARNVAYAARFLASLHNANTSWAEAVARYHSADPERGRAYRERVMAVRAGAGEQAPRQPSRPDGGLTITEADLRQPDSLADAWQRQQTAMRQLSAAGKPSRLARLVIVGDKIQDQKETAR